MMMMTIIIIIIIIITFQPEIHKGLGMCLLASENISLTTQTSDRKYQFN